LEKEKTLKTINIKQYTNKSEKLSIKILKENLKFFLKKKSLFIKRKHEPFVSSSVNKKNKQTNKQIFFIWLITQNLNIIFLKEEKTFKLIFSRDHNVNEDI